ncbi:MAG TPA: DUF87 domain-containing protein [Actinomycetota bacterium]|nr:DUF87 domain-containing protein [Actinomycetota bacterium]
MNDRSWRVAYLVIAVGGAISAALISGAPAGFAEPQGRWLEIVVVLSVSALLFEPFFSGAGPAVANSLLAILGAVAIGFEEPGLPVLLVVIASSALLLLIVSFVLKGQPTPGRHERLAAVLQRIGTTLGGWHFLLTGALSVSLIVNNVAFGRPWAISAVTVLFLLAVTKLPPHELISELRGGRVRGEDLYSVRLFPPHELVVMGAGVSALSVGDVVSVEGSGKSEAGLVAAPTVFEGRAAVRVFTPTVSSALFEGDISKLRVVPGATGDQSSVIERAVAELADQGPIIFGTVSEKSSIEELRVELLPGQDVEVGDLIWTLRGDSRLFWQVAEASVERVAWGGDSHRAVIASAHQVGQWNGTRSAFQVDTRSPGATDLVFGGKAVGADIAPLADGQTEIGTIPGSTFPARLDLRELSLHHAAILGVTGTGKTHLSFALAKSLAAGGTRVICVDTTGQYSTRFKAEEAEEITFDTTKPFLDSGKPLAVYRPDTSKVTITEGKALAENLFKWAKAQPKLGEDDRARLVLMFEEAQNFVPETFVIDECKLKAESQATSRIIMESRKFGLGFVLISQRTAMVTKSALSQCNTVFAFQAFDQTGLDYLEGICGSALAKGIPNLPQQTAVVMGRGLTSSRPLIVRISDAEVVVR